MSDPKPYAMCKFVNNFPDFWASYPFTTQGRYIYMGEIPNMRGHCVVADHNTGQIFSGYHVENFVELTEDEV